jgi:hypothetical protein
MLPTPKEALDAYAHVVERHPRHRLQHAAADDLLGVALDDDVDLMWVQVTQAQLHREVGAGVAERRPLAEQSLLPRLVRDVEDLIRVQQQLTRQVVVKAAQHLGGVVGILRTPRPTAKLGPLLGRRHPDQHVPVAQRVIAAHDHAMRGDPLVYRLDRLWRETEFVQHPPGVERRLQLTWIDVLAGLWVPHKVDGALDERPLDRRAVAALQTE